MRPCSQLWLLFAATVVTAQQKPADLASELRQWSTAIEEGRPVDTASLPSEWSVEVSDELFTISTTPLKTYLESGSRKKRRRKFAPGWTSSPILWKMIPTPNPTRPPPPNSSRSSLVPEFRPPNPPTRWDLFWKEFGRWIEALLERLFGITGSHPGSIQLFLWVLLIGASGILVTLLMRSWRHEHRSGPLSPGRPPDLALNSEAWIAAAQSARRHGDIAGSIQCCYWAGITHLQEDGKLPPHFTHTPREHLRLLSGRHDLRAALGVLCGCLERCWYARVTPGDQDLVSCFGALKELGCAVD
ncbi:MAG: hypothetical protein QM757_18115 [Paludibaculum sp.]